MSLLLLASLLSVAPAQGEKSIFPSAGKPDNFSEAAGLYDRLSVRASPTTVQVEEPITLVVRITSLVPGPFAHPPQRDKLKLFPKTFENDFFIEELPEQDRFLAEQNAWEFAYRVFPRHSGVKVIPSLTFAYFKTNGAQEYKAVDSDEIAISVKPRLTVQMDTPALIRARMHPAVFGKDLLGGNGPGTPLIVLAFALPPVLCMAGVILWQRLFPDAAASARLRRSRAFRQAAKQLRRLGRRPPAEAVARVVILYLRARIDLTTAEPTPLEIKIALLAAGLPQEVAQSAERFCHSCDAERFGDADSGAPGRLAEEATRVLQAVEGALSSEAPRSGGRADQESKQRTPFLAPLLLFSFSPFLLLSVSSTNADTLLTEADRCFQKGMAIEQDSTAAHQEFARAARLYQEVVDSGTAVSPALFRQLGDAYLLAGDLPHAILAYRRGLKVGPQVQALWDHLELARDRVPYPGGDQRYRPPASDWPSWLPRPSAAMLSMIAAGLHALAWLALAWWWTRRQSATLTWAVVLLAAALGALAWWGYMVWRQDQEERQAFAVVAYNNMTLRRGNGTLFAPHGELPVVHGGMEARLLRERAGWVQVEFPGGEVGWLPRRAILR
jgi:hypothetical protein